MVNRRTFLTVAGGTVAGLALPGCDWGSANRRLDRIGLQLYTVRQLMAADLDGTLAQVAAVGYQEVEFAGYFGRTPQQIRDALAAVSLDSPSTHVPFESLETGWAQALADARTIGHRFVVVAFIPQERRQTLDQWRQIAALFNAAGAAAKQEGLQFAYHNHDFEFVPIGGQIPYDILVTETNPAEVALQVDLYWMTKAGRDPRVYFRRFPGRFPMVHVKDSAGPPTHRMVDVGSGVIDFRRIFRMSGEAGIRHFFVEHDSPADPMATIRTSYQYLRNLEF